VTLAKTASAGLQAVGDALDALTARESATHIADVLAVAVSTITRRNEGDKLRTYPLADGLLIVREYRREFPELQQRAMEFLDPATATTAHLGVEERAEAALTACLHAFEDLIPLARCVPPSDAGQARLARRISELIRASQKLRNAQDVEKAKRAGGGF
jgi:hypothetical protein